jgi:beta-galactosidase
MWADDAAQMKALGLEYVRIAEFAWSRLEPSPGQYQFEWLDEAIATLGDAGLKVIMCTPTATPPKWLIDQYPEVLPVDPDTGRVRGFGSRRHYDFSSERYLQEALRISRVVAERYGAHDAVVGWQTDNELCCHDTTLSGSATALAGFRQWCQRRYGDIDTLNTQWGNVFWSLEYRSFDEIELPIGAVTETSPAHRLAYRRYSSDQVLRFHNKQVDIIRELAPGRWVTHNFIPMKDTNVDCYALAAPLDFVSYDNYPLGRTDFLYANSPPEVVRPHMRTGHPDYSSYYHDQCRGLNAGAFWVMEQQPGPVNWAPHNPRPAPGMIRLWTLEAFAHGAACVSYFRWRQAHFAQEQMHAGLLRPDNSKTEAWQAASQVLGEINALGLDAVPQPKASVAIITTVEAQWVSEIELQGAGYSFNKIQLDYYSALRQIGVDVDFISVDADFSSYSLIVAPCLPIVDEAFVEKCKSSNAICVFGPRSGAKTPEFGYPVNLPPGPLQRLIPLRVLSVETLRPDCAEPLEWNGRQYESASWCEEIDAPDAQVLARYADGNPAVVRYEQAVYLATLTNIEFLKDFFTSLCEAAGVETLALPQDVRVCRRGNLVFAFNYSADPQVLPVPDGARFELGQQTLAPRDVAVWRAA